MLDVEGVFIPGNEVKLVQVDDMNDAWRPTKQVYPETDDKEFIPAFGRSFLLEVSRGCARGCRFCMAGCLYRPRREADIKTLLQTAEEGRKATGLDKIALIGGAVSDYSRIEELCSELLNVISSYHSILRVESESRNLLESLKKSDLKPLPLPLNHPGD